MSLKAQVREVNSLIKAKKFSDAVVKAKDVVSQDPTNMNAFLLLGFALDNLNKFDDAESAYRSAAKINPTHHAPWQGLCKLADHAGLPYLHIFKEALENIIPLLIEANEVAKLRDFVDKFLDLAATSGNKLQYIDALQLITPDNRVYGSLEGMVPHPKVTFEKIIALTEAEEKRTISRLIGERRTRLGATLTNVTRETRLEVYSHSYLEHWIRLMINWCNDDDMRRTYEEKLLQHCLDKLEVQKDPELQKISRQKVMDIADGMVVVRHPFQLGWDLSLGWQDHKEIQDYDVTKLREYCEFFPGSDLTKVITAFLCSEVSPFPPEKNEKQMDEESGESSTDEEEIGGMSLSGEPVTVADRIILMMDGIASSESLLAYRFLGNYYVYLEEWNSCIDLMKNAMEFAEKEKNRSGLKFAETVDAFRIYLGTALVYHQSPRHHSEAMKLFNTVLERDPSTTAAMIGVGMIFEEEEELEKASDFLIRALLKDPGNLKVKSEAAWVKTQLKQFEDAEAELKECLVALRKQKTPNSELLSIVLYRIGFCMWEKDPRKSARKSRQGPYFYWIDALKADFNNAPAYSALGLYYLNYACDKRRARKCFQKALELSANEVVSAEQLARSYANDGDWEKVELVARRIIESGKVRPPPGSKRQGISWPFSALGTACLNKQEFHEAIVNYQAALRMSPQDYHSWVSLAESYHRSGRHIAAMRSIEHAQSLEKEGLVMGLGDTWFTQYLSANIKRELGEFDDAIALYRDIYKSHENEHIIIISLLQTLVDGALYNIEKGLYGQAVQLAADVIRFGKAVAAEVNKSFNYWKALGDAASVFISVRSQLELVPVSDLIGILTAYRVVEADEILVEYDKTSFKSFKEQEPTTQLGEVVALMIIAHKHAISVSVDDTHAQAVAYYNLGWAEMKAHSSLILRKRNKPSKYSHTAVRAFKRAIELEAKNAEFWNAIGVATTYINPQVSQHAFVRSLHLDERNPVTWTNYGVLALEQNDLETATQAFTRAQSNDPDYADAWLGHAFCQKIMGDETSFRAHVVHAISLSSGSNLTARQHFGASMFDRLLKTPVSNMEDNDILEPLFYLGQAKNMNPEEFTYPHLYTLFQERINAHGQAVELLKKTAERAEADYEVTEDPEALGRFVIFKTDLARSYLASKQYEKAIEAANFALDLTEEAATNELTPDQRSKARLSAHLTVGLSYYFIKDPTSAIESFHEALKETDNHPDTVCLLAQVLWATGTKDNRHEARDKLMDQIEKHGDHIQSILLLAVICILDNDMGSLKAAVYDLNEKRMTTGLSEATYQAIGTVLSAAAALTPGNSSADVRGQIQADIMLHPGLPHGWIKLAELEGMEKTIGELAVEVARQGLPPRAKLRAEDVAVAFAGTKKPADAQMAIMLAPWEGKGWQSLAEGVMGTAQKRGIFDVRNIY